MGDPFPLKSKEAGAANLYPPDSVLLKPPGLVTTTSTVPVAWAGTPENLIVVLSSKNVRIAEFRPTSASWTNVRFAPDGQRLALDSGEGGSADIWLFDWARGGLTRLTLDPAQDRQSVWAPDGASHRVCVEPRG